MENKKTCLYDKHVALGAQMQPFAGFEMPILYSSIIEEHQAVRQHCGVFDVSHMGEAYITGADAERFVNHIFTNDVAGAPINQVFYGMMLYPDGGTVDDLLVYKMGVDGENVIISRTGYTGEDGFEIYGSHAYIINTWDALMASKRCVPCGLGCRDTLRFEVGLPLYGNELSAEISPVMAGLSMFCKLDKEEFIGKEAIVKQKEEGVKQRVIGLELQEKAIPRHGYAVLRDGKQVGVITTGYHAISVDKSVAFALVNKEDAKLGTELEIQIRKKTFKCVVVKKRFYDKHYKKD